MNNEKRMKKQQADEKWEPATDWAKVGYKGQKRVKSMGKKE